MATVYPSITFQDIFEVEVAKQIKVQDLNKKTKKLMEEELESGNVIIKNGRMLVTGSQSNLALP